MGADYSYGLLSARNRALLRSAVEGTRESARAWTESSRRLHAATKGKYTHPVELIDLTAALDVDRITTAFLYDWGGVLEVLAHAGHKSILVPIADDPMDVGAYAVWVLGDDELKSIDRELRAPGLVDALSAIRAGGKLARSADMFGHHIASIQRDIDALRALCANVLKTKAAMYCEMA